MTLQQIADYAMFCLNYENVAAEYFIEDGAVKVVTDCGVYYTAVGIPRRQIRNDLKRLAAINDKLNTAQ